MLYDVISFVTVYVFLEIQAGVGHATTHRNLHCVRDETAIRPPHSGDYYNFSTRALSRNAIRSDHGHYLRRDGIFAVSD